MAMASGAGEVYALVNGCDTCDSGLLYRSPVSHDSWTEVPGVTGRFDPGEAGVVAEGSTVFVWADLPKPELLRASNGTDFTSLPIPCPPGSADEPVPFELGSLAASDPEDVAVACLGVAGAGSQEKQMFVSHNGGTTFLPLPVPVPGGGIGAQLAMPSATTVLFGTGSAATSVYRVAGPDNSWAASFMFSDGGVGLSDLAFVDPSHGAFVHGPASFVIPLLDSPDPPPEPGEVYLTDDGGSSWYPVDIGA